MITWPWSKIEGVTAEDKKDRPVLADVYFEVGEDGEGLLIAADGFILAVVPVEHGPEDTTGHIPVSVIEVGRRLFKRERLHIVADYEIVRLPPGAEKYARYRGSVSFPDWREVVPSYESADYLEKDDVVSVILDVRHLMRLAEALCQHEESNRKPNYALRLTFHRDGDQPVFVEPIADEGKVKGRYGVIMPIVERQK